VALLAETTGDHYEMVGRLAGGETGAHEITGPGAERLVLKWDTRPSSILHRRQAIVLSERLRADAGWPIAHQRTVVTDDCLFVLQDFMPGEPVEEFGHPLLDRLLALHQGRLGLARAHDPSQWPAGLVKTLTTGGEGYCLHDSLRRYDERTASLVTRIETFGHGIDQGAFVGRDVVHWDLHPGNLLQVGGTLSAVVDSDFALVGDARFDLVMLALTSLTVRCDRGVQGRLFAAAFDGLADLQKQAYLGHLFLRFLDWPIRRGARDEIDFWLTQADQMLDV
jgi:hypothetical protein